MGKWRETYSTGERVVDSREETQVMGRDCFGEEQLQCVEHAQPRAEDRDEGDSWGRGYGLVGISEGCFIL